MFTNENIFSIERLPESLVVLGAGPIGIELGQAFVRLGVKVRIIELLDRILYVYACGDVVGPYLFSHMAGYQGVTAALNACLPFGRKADYNGGLWTTFTDPELSIFL